MHFTDTYGPTLGPNLRVFNVLVEGQIAFENLDIVVEAGGGSIALQKSVTASVTDGVLTIEFEHNIQNPAVSAIEVHSLVKDPTPIFINAGGSSFVDSFGNEWVADTDYHIGGHSFVRSVPISGTSMDELYQSQRYAKPGDPSMKYEIPLKEGMYDVYFHFCDMYRKVNAPGQRVFSVWAEGSLLLEDLDVFSETGDLYTALVKKETIFVADGGLTLEFERKKQNPMISAIEIHSAVHASPPGVFSTPTPSYPLQTAAGSSLSFEPIFINSNTDFVNTGLTFVKPVPINGTEDDTLYQSERWDVFNGPSMIYDIPVPNGVYDVFLHWAAIFTKAQEPNKRVFDVFIEDELIFEDFDIFAEVGGYTALVKQTIAVVEDGALTIRFGHKIRDPKICGIEIRLAPPSSAPSMAPSISAYPTAPTHSPVPSEVPSVAPSIYPTATLLPWIDLDENEDYTARHECSFVQAGAKFYLFGGRENLSKLDIYDYTTDTWTQGATAPKPFNHFQAVSYQGLIWVIGAFETNNFPDEIATDNVYVYDPAGDVWMIGPSITWPRGAGGLVVYKDKFYLLGGNSAGHDGGFVPWLDEYDPQTGKWRLLRDAPHSRDHFHAAVIGDKLYAAGRRRTIRGNTLGDTVKEVDVYDFEKGEWLSSDLLPRDLPVPRAAAATAEFDGKLVLMGGETRENSEAHDRVDALDPITGRWSTLTPMNHKRHGMQAIVSGESVFVAGGSPRRGGGQQKNMEVYNKYGPVGIRMKANSGYYLQAKVR